MSIEADVVVVGAGLAGLAAAHELGRAGLSVIVLEASDAPGGRIRTDVVGGFRLDRGFQLLNPSYPRIRKLISEHTIDPVALQLHTFDAGVRVALQGRSAILADPRRSRRQLAPTLSDLAATLRAPTGSLAEKAAFAAWGLHCATAPARRLINTPDRPYRDTLDRWHLSGALRATVLEPFLAGVLGEDDGETSSRFAELVIRSFVRGTPGVPALGMQALPDQLAATLRPGTIRCNVRAEKLEATRVHTPAGPITARSVLIATEARAASELGAIPMPMMRSLTTFWFSADHSPLPRPILSLDGLRRGPIVNTAVMSQAAPTYSPDHRALIGCTMLGLPAAESERQVRQQMALIYPGAPTGEWDLLRVDAIDDALPAMIAPLQLRKPAQIGDHLFIAGDHRDTASQQGALASGARVARALIDSLGSNPR